MNLNHLAIFHAVAEEGSVSRGAARLFISQPAVSKQLSEFEATLGTRLFDRLPRGVRLTEAGILLHSYSRRLFGLEEEAERALAELQGLERGRLFIGASTSIGSYLLPEVLVAFHRAYPHIELHLTSGNTEEIQQRLRDGSLDLGLTEGFVDADDLEADVFYDDELVAIVAPDHILTRESEVTIDRLLKEPFVLREAGSGTRAVLERAIHEAGLALPDPVLILDSQEAIKRTVAAGVGVTVVSCLAVATDVLAGRLTILPLVGVTLRRPLHRLRLKGKYEGRSTLAFLAMLRQIVPYGVPSSQGVPLSVS